MTTRDVAPGLRIMKGQPQILVRVPLTNDDEPLYEDRWVGYYHCPWCHGDGTPCEHCGGYERG